VTDKLIAERYAKALIRLMKPQDFDNFLSDIDFLNQVFKSSDHAKTIDSFLFPKKERMEMSHTILEQTKNVGVWQNLFSLLIHKHRFSLINTLLSELEEAIYQAKNAKKVRLILAQKQSQEIVEKIRKKIETIIGKQVIFVETIDSTIIGGFIAKTESFVIDGSIQHNLIKLTQIAEL
jgi:ATP synthase F1 delta subunit